jgi:hypothetical protein
VISLFNLQKEHPGWEPQYQGTEVYLHCLLRRSEDEEDWLWGGTNTRLLLAAATFGGLVLSLGGSLIWRAARSRWGTGR